MDLGGINPVENPGVYRFKSRMKGREISYIGTYDAFANAWKKQLWRLVETLYRKFKK